MALVLLLLCSGCLSTELPPEPTAAMEIELTEAVTHQPIVFNGSLSDDVKYTITDYLWNFGDGEGATGPVVTHSYAKPGIYNVRLVVLNSKGGGDRVTKKVTVNRPNTPPIAEAGPDQIISIGRTITFNGGASTDDEGEIINYNWSFGDNSWGEGKVVDHVYTTEGFYVVRLTITDEDNATDTDTLVVEVTLKRYRVTWDVFHQVKVDSDNTLSEGQREDRLEQLSLDNLTQIYVNITWTDELDSGLVDLLDPDTFNLSVTGQDGYSDLENDNDGDIPFYFEISNVPPPLTSVEAYDLADLYSKLDGQGYWTTTGRGEWRVVVIMEEANPDNPLPPPAIDPDTGNDYHLDFDYVYYKARVTEL